MNAPFAAIGDSLTMFRRQLIHIRRYPSLTFFVVAMPVVFLLIFVYVLGGTMGAGLMAAGVNSSAGTGSDAREAYLEFITPGILIMAIAGVVQGTAIGVGMDMTTGIIARFRTMSISRMSVLMGHVLGGMFQAALTLALVLAVSILIGFRTSASAMDWVGVAGVLAMTSFALIWLTAALGMATNSVEAASNIGMPIVLLVFLSSGFVPADSLPGPLQFFAEYQPFTPIIDTIRGLLGGQAVAGPAAAATAWCVVITGLSFLWARRLYNRDPIR
jgi:ABC-2 type transport system permease protein